MKATTSLVVTLLAGGTCAWARHFVALALRATGRTERVAAADRGEFPGLRLGQLLRTNRGLDNGSKNPLRIDRLVSTANILDLTNDESNPAR